MTNDPLSPLLVVILAVPVVSAGAVALLGPGRQCAIRWTALAAVLVNLVLAVIVVIDYVNLPPESPSADNPGAQQSAATATFHPRLTTRWTLLSFGKPTSAARAESPAIQFFIGLDGLNLWLVLLTALLMVSAVLVSWTAVGERVNEYYAWLLLLATAMTGVFLAFDIILFYVFFELTLIPLFFLIGIWGGPQRQYAARKFFIYTLTGSLLTLLGALGVVAVCYLELHELTFSIPRLVSLVNGHLAGVAPDSADFAFWKKIELLVFAFLMVGFAVKVPLVPVHTWLPLAHVEAPTAGSVLLAGVLLKIGVYGFLRLCLPLAPDASLTFGAPLIATLAVIGIIYGALCSLAQDDIKKLVAYSSVSHLGFCMLGLFALNEAGLSGSLLQMVNHGLSTGALFLLVGMLYERYHTRKLADYGGMAARLHLLALFMVFICLTSVGLPGLNGFVGEVLVLMGTWDIRGVPVNGVLLTCLASTGVVLGAWYLFTMLKRVFFGPVHEPAHEGHGPVRDLNLRELAAVVPIAVACVLIGVYPQPMLNTSQKDIKVVTTLTDGARSRANPDWNKPLAETPTGVKMAVGEGTP